MAEPEEEKVKAHPSKNSKLFVMLRPSVQEVKQGEVFSMFAGASVGIDVLCMLHQVLSRSDVAAAVVIRRDINPFLDVVVDKITLLAGWCETLYVVFDGNDHPSKRRKSASTAAKLTALHAELTAELVKIGNRLDLDSEESKPCMRLCKRLAGVISRGMYDELILRLGAIRNVVCVVSPFESDHQLVGMQRQGVVRYVITEDTDLLVNGCDVVKKFHFGHKWAQAQVLEKNRIMRTAGELAGMNESDALSLLNQYMGKSEAKSALLLYGCIFKFGGDRLYDFLRLFASTTRTDYGDIKGVGPKRSLVAIAANGVDNLKAVALAICTASQRKKRGYVGEVYTEVLRSLICFKWSIVVDVAGWYQRPLYPHDGSIAVEHIEERVGKVEESERLVCESAIGCGAYTRFDAELGADRPTYDHVVIN